MLPEVVGVPRQRVANNLADLPRQGLSEPGCARFGPVRLRSFLGPPAGSQRKSFIGAMVAVLDSAAQAEPFLDIASVPKRLAPRAFCLALSTEQGAKAVGLRRGERSIRRALEPVADPFPRVQLGDVGPLAREVLLLEEIVEKVHGVEALLAPELLERQPAVKVPGPVLLELRDVRPHAGVHFLSPLLLDPFPQHIDIELEHADEAGQPLVLVLRKDLLAELLRLSTPLHPLLPGSLDLDLLLVPALLEPRLLHGSRPPAAAAASPPPRLVGRDLALVVGLRSVLVQVMLHQLRVVAARLLGPLLPRGQCPCLRGRVQAEPLYLAVDERVAELLHVDTVVLEPRNRRHGPCDWRLHPHPVIPELLQLRQQPLLEGVAHPAVEPLHPGEHLAGRVTPVVDLLVEVVGALHGHVELEVFHLPAALGSAQLIAGEGLQQLHARCQGDLCTGNGRRGGGNPLARRLPDGCRHLLDPSEVFLPGSRPLLVPFHVQEPRPRRVRHRCRTRLENPLQLFMGLLAPAFLPLLNALVWVHGLVCPLLGDCRC
mmetsp:Transcript_21621/g.51649  ORF Transcript_21621/g.51649 Transcript_21621/m.51649 type:complete len:543 (+) Transcript_21621:998-2626(+)